MILFCTGSKGGVGKSLLAMALLNYLETRNRAPVLVETDTSNPDVFKAYSDSVESHALDLDRPQGWERLLDVASGAGGRPVVVNHAARGNPGLRYAGDLRSAADRIGPLTALFLLNRGRDSIELLGEFRDRMPEARIYPVLNEIFGRAGLFELYRTSEVRMEIEQQTKTLILGALADRVTTALGLHRWTLAVARTELPFTDRVELERWLVEVETMLEGVL